MPSSPPPLPRAIAAHPRPFVACALQAVTGMRHLDYSCGQILPIGSCPPMLVGYNATAPGIFLEFDPTSLECRERSFDDALKIDFASMTASVDTDGATHLGGCYITALRNASRARCAIESYCRCIRRMIDPEGMWRPDSRSLPPSLSF